MIYLIATVGLGIFCGLAVPSKWKSVWILFAFGVLLLGIGLALAIGYSYGVSSLVDLFALRDETDKGILIQFVVIGYASLLGAAINGFRSLFRQISKKRTFENRP